MKKLSLIIVSLVVLMMSWEGSLEASGIIPDDSIRIRILANSDSVSDQWIKRKVRDAIIAETKAWTPQLVDKEIQSARQIIETYLPEIHRITEQTLTQYGFYYGAEVELGPVDFPAKIYGNRMYPENQYEALRISLGEGKGENWWCVLFPPLCFIDGTTVSNDYPQNVVDKNVDNQEKNDNAKKNARKANKSATKQGKTSVEKPKVKPALFIVDLWNSWF